tara:strand:+ start:1072 stop:2301 length:1230 start_codon:yes stop_codon:yes gene_type:complete
MEENKEVVEQTTEQSIEQPIEQVVETKTEQPRDEKGQFKSKFESAGDDSVVKVDLSKPPPVKEEVVEKETNVINEEEPKIEEIKEVQETQEEQNASTSILEEVTNQEAEKIEEQIEEAVTKAESTGKPLPENVQKLVDFMDQTGGDINDYVKLNRDTEKMDDSEVLDEYYRSTKSHLTPEERSFLLEETYGVNEDMDDDKAIRMKKIALKEQVAEARAHLDRQKSKYYEEIKAGSKLTEEQQQAIDFFNRHNKESEEREKLSKASKESFQQKTESVFNKNFKGFEYSVGDKKYRFNVKDVDKVKTTQSDINNFVNKFADKEKSTISDATGYHKSLFTAMNADVVASHFYEQGKADAIKNRIAKDKNINTDSRKTHGETNVGGIKYKVLGESSSDITNRSFKIKSNKKKN